MQVDVAALPPAPIARRRAARFYPGDAPAHLARERSTCQLRHHSHAQVATGPHAMFGPRGMSSDYNSQQH